MRRLASLIPLASLLASCAARVDRCPLDPTDLHPTDTSNRCIVSPDLHARWSIERTGDLYALVQENLDGAPWRLPLAGFDFFLAARPDGGVLVVEWMNGSPFAGVRIDLVRANGSVERVVDDLDTGNEWSPSGLSVAADGSFVVARYLHEGAATTLTAYAANGDRRWRVVEPGTTDAPLIDAQGRLFFATASDDPPGGDIVALTPEGEEIWRYEFPFNRAATSLGATQDGVLVFDEWMASYHTPTNELGERFYHPITEPRVCALSKGGTFLGCTNDPAARPPTLTLPDDGTHRIP